MHFQVFGWFCVMKVVVTVVPINFHLLMFKKALGTIKISKNTKNHILLPIASIGTGTGTKNHEKSSKFDFRAQNHVCLQLDVLYYFCSFRP